MKSSMSWFCPISAQFRMNSFFSSKKKKHRPPAHLQTNQTTPHHTKPHQTPLHQPPSSWQVFLHQTFNNANIISFCLVTFGHKNHVSSSLLPEVYWANEQIQDFKLTHQSIFSHKFTSYLLEFSTIVYCVIFAPTPEPVFI